MPPASPGMSSNEIIIAIVVPLLFNAFGGEFMCVRHLQKEQDRKLAEHFKIEVSELETGE